MKKVIRTVALGAAMMSLGVLAALNQKENRPLFSSAIDRLLEEKWKEKGVTPAPLSGDHEFIRRVYLDLTGGIPTAGQAKAFLESGDPQKRSATIEKLLHGPEYSQYYGSYWTDLFLGHGRDRFVDRKAFHQWWEKQLSVNAGWDQIASQLIAADGSLDNTPALNWYVRHRLDAGNLADDTSRYFLGIQLGCARCHNHPHDQWKLEDYYGLAAFYSGLKRDEFSYRERLKVRELRRKRQEMVEEYRRSGESGMDRREAEQARMKMMEDFRGMLRLSQDRSTSLQAEIRGETKTYPAKFLLEAHPAVIKDQKRRDLAAWVTSQENPFFARAFANRIWSILMGKGLVDPIDDMSNINTPASPELLDLLAGEFQRSGYDIRFLFSSIANSRAYQLSSSSQSGPVFYESAKVQMMNADQLLQSFLTATSIESALQRRNREDYEQRREMIYRYHVFLFDNDDNRAASTNYEPAIPQALFLLNGKMTNEATRPHYGNTLSNILRENREPEPRIRELFLATLSRKPSDDEMRAILARTSAKQNPEAYEDLFWALLNSDEFLFNH